MSVHVPPIRQPEYTGENRCLPCTVVNVGIASIGSVAIAIWSPLLAATVFSVALILIYLRGYLVPGTPALTKRYFPQSVLGWFGKEATLVPEGLVTIEPEQILIEAKAVTPCETRPDLCLDMDFETSWRERMHTTITDHTTKGLRDALGAERDRISFVKYGDALVARDRDVIIGQWPSRAAKVADIAAAAEFNQQYPGWHRLNVAEKARVLLSLRVLLEECPDCGGAVRLGQEVVDSCCQSYDAVLSSCQECDAKLFEMEWQDEFAPTERAVGTERPSTV